MHGKGFYYNSFFYLLYSKGVKKIYIILSNGSHISIKTSISFKVYSEYKKTRNEVLSCKSNEQRFKKLSYIFVEQSTESPITYEDYDSLKREDLVRVAEELLKANEPLVSEYQELSSELDILARINTGFENLITSYDQRLAKSLTPLAEAAYDAFKAFHKIDFQPIRESILNAHEKLTKFTKTIQGLFSEEFLRSLIEFAANTDNTILLVKVRMIETGWISVVEIEEDVVWEVISSLSEYENEIDANIFNEVVNEHMSKIYTKENINSLLDGWESQNWLKKRQQILKSAIDAHLRGEYFLSVPVFLAQLEGIIRDVVPHDHEKAHLTNSHIREYLKPIHENYEEIELAEIFDEYLRENIHVNFITGQPLKSELGRNAILHGADTEYGIVTNSLKAINLFDYVQRLLSKQYNLK